MSDTVIVERRKISRTPLDMFVIVFCLSGALSGAALLYSNINKTLTSSSEEAGEILSSEKEVIRMLGGSFLTDRLSKGSTFYYGDIISVASMSSARLDMFNKGISLNLKEYAVYLVEKDKIEITGNFTILSNSKTVLNINGRDVIVNPGDEILGVYEEDKDNEDVKIVFLALTGNPQIIIDGEEREMSKEIPIVFDSSNNIVLKPSLIMREPQNNARFLKRPRALGEIEFIWASSNLQPEELILEIASDQNFSVNHRRIRDPQSGLREPLDSGIWFWQMVYNDTVLSSGRLSVTEPSPPNLIRPLQRQIFTAEEDLDEVRFSWSRIGDADYYVLQISSTEDFSGQIIKREPSTTSLSLSISEIGVGTWYWRVRAEYPSVFRGSAGFSQIYSFFIERPASAAERQPQETAQAEESVIREEQQAAEEQQVREPPPAQPVELSPLPPPGNRQPASGYYAGIEQFRQRPNIIFSWNAVSGANGYIITFYRDVYPRPQQIFQDVVRNRLTYTLEDFSLFESGSYIWEIEAVQFDNMGRIIRGGRRERNTFTFDVPRPGRVQTRDVGTLYGTE
ncbi:MAG: hypothetical protein FWD28_03365 [Treponema sp.]|nr:hypothetical protein [Treponema sp.]